MLKHYIENYVKNMSIDDIINYSNKLNYKLNSNEANIIYKTIKEHWETIVFGNHIIILNKIKDNISDDLYNKMNELIINYKNKYNALIKPS